MGVGTSSGHVLLFDLRSSRPHLTKDHNNGLPVHTVTHHPASENVISADAKGIKIWSESSGDNYTSIEAAADLNQVCLCFVLSMRMVEFLSLQSDGKVCTAGELLANACK